MRGGVIGVISTVSLRGFRGRHLGLCYCYLAAKGPRSPVEGARPNKGVKLTSARRHETARLQLTPGVGPIERTRGTRLGKNETKWFCPGGLLAAAPRACPHDVRGPLRSAWAILGTVSSGPEPSRVTAAWVSRWPFVDRGHERYSVGRASGTRLCYSRRACLAIEGAVGLQGGDRMAQQGREAD